MRSLTVKAGPKLAQARASHAAVRLKDGRVLIIGGMIPWKGECGMACVPPPIASVEIYDPRTGTLSSGGSLATARAGARALLLDDGRVLVYGGFFDDGFEIYDPGRKTSRALKPPAGMKAFPADSTAVKMADGRVLVAGGTYDMAASSSNTTLIFDPATGSFTAGPNMAAPREGATAILLRDGRVLVVGGDDYEAGYGHANADAELIDPSLPLGSVVVIPLRHNVSTATLLSDGRVLVTEWETSEVSCPGPAISEVFDPATETFSAAGFLKAARFGPTAVATRDGRALVLGGEGPDCGHVDTVEAFDAVSGTFQVVATGFPRATGFSATLLDDGSILVAGGSRNDAPEKMTAATWLIEP